MTDTDDTTGAPSNPTTATTVVTSSTSGTSVSAPPETDTEGSSGTGEPSGCAGDEPCTLIDILFVVDNSRAMGDEQLNLGAALPVLVEQLNGLSADGRIAEPDVNIMVTTSDFGHPLCTDFKLEGYTPAQGAPIFTGCNERLEFFTSVDPVDPVVMPEACTQHCESDIVPGGDPFIHYDSSGSNVSFNDVAGALSCVAPVGISGCGYEAPLETMLHALRPDVCWNDPSVDGCDGHPEWNWVTRGFLREGSILAVAILSDEEDCSVLSPDGYRFFTNPENDEYWEEHPDSGVRSASSATCWNAGVSCEDNDGDGIKESCVPREAGDALHPVQRYVDFLDSARDEFGHEVVMLGVFGVPPVTEHSATPPFEPIAGGVHALEYRDWRDGEYDGTAGGGDILPSEWASGVTAAHKTWEFGIGPGCTAQRGDGSYAGQALPPVRLREVCESRNYSDNGQDRVRCCIESICDEDLGPAMSCLASLIEDAAGGGAP